MALSKIPNYMYQDPSQTQVTPSLPAGSVIQTGQAVKYNVQSHSGTSFTDISGLSVTLTPTYSNSKFIISWSVIMGQSLQHHQSVGRVVRTISGADFVDSYVATADGARGRNTWGTQDGAVTHGNMDNYAGCIMDSPATGSAVTYRLQMAGEGGTTWINRGYEADGNSSISPRTISTLLIQEIKA